MQRLNAAPPPRLSALASKRDAYADLLHDTRGLRGEEQQARDLFVSKLGQERRDQLFELEVLLKSMACFSNPRNHPGATATRSHHRHRLPRTSPADGWRDEARDPSRANGHRRARPGVRVPPLLGDASPRRCSAHAARARRDDPGFPRRQPAGSAPRLHQSRGGERGVAQTAARAVPAVLFHGRYRAA